MQSSPHQHMKVLVSPRLGQDNTNDSNDINFITLSDLQDSSQLKPILQDILYFNEKNDSTLERVTPSISIGEFDECLEISFGHKNEVLLELWIQFALELLKITKENRKLTSKVSSPSHKMQKKDDEESKSSPPLSPSSLTSPSMKRASPHSPSYSWNIAKTHLLSPTSKGNKLHLKSPYERKLENSGIEQILSTHSVENRLIFLFRFLDQVQYIVRILS